MRVKVKLFAAARELVGKGTLALDLPAGATVDMLSAQLFDAWPGLRDMRLRFAVNAAYAGLDTVLRDGDEIALIPPVGGG
ncbi:MAG: MoaD/ThiS family protein [Anaerolineae bacterium]|nr:MoaD/ThiS family protein [Anaerolineae bacterium]